MITSIKSAIEAGKAECKYKLPEGEIERICIACLNEFFESSRLDMCGYEGFCEGLVDMWSDKIEDEIAEYKENMT